MPRAMWWPLPDMAPSGYGPREGGCFMLYGLFRIDLGYGLFRIDYDVVVWQWEVNLSD